MQKSMPELSIRNSCYTGPIDTLAFREQCDTHTYVLRLAGTIASSAGGVINTVFDSFSQVGATSAWTQLSALYNEFRVLAMKVHMLPVNKYQTASTQFPILSVVDRVGTTALSSLTDAAAYASCMEHVTGSTVTRVVRMDGLDEGVFANTASGPSTSARLYVKLYGSGLAASTNYYQYLNTIVVQMRGLQA